MRSRPRLARALLVVVPLLLVATALAGYAGRTLSDPDRFADRAADALRDPAVRDLAAERLTDRLVRARPDLLAARPLVLSSVAGVVGGDAFGSLFRRAVDDVHRAVFRRDRDSVTLTLADVGIVVAAALEQLRPDLAAELDSPAPVRLLDRDIGSVGGDAARLVRTLSVLAYVLAALTLAAAAAAVALSADRRAAVARLGAGIVAAGAVVVAAEIVARALVLDRFDDPDERAAAAGVWDAFAGDLRATGLLIAAVGAIVAAAAASLITAVDVERPLHAAWRAVVREPASTPLRVLRGIALVCAGALAIAAPLPLLRIAVMLGGVYVLYKGIEALLRLINRSPERAPAARRPRRRPGRRAARLAAPLVAAVLVVLALAGFAAGGGVDAPDARIGACNGHAELCDRALDDVTLPATHNSMSVPLPGWFASLHERPIEGQLEDGIRGLLLDTHYADRLENGRTRTHFAGTDDFRRAIQQDGVSEKSVQAALRLRERAGFRGAGERGMYLCHTFCELGATPVAGVLDEIRDFLVNNPGEVVVIINQDYVTPQDFVAAVAAAGLAPLVLTPPPAGAPWPTLGELVERDRRLVILAENEAGAAPWYQLAYERLTEETPFTFKRTAELTGPATLPASCADNRGPEDAPLFLVNHWINTDPLPRPANAETVNARAVLLRRARTCERIRHQRVNLLAVDFYARGDVFGVADELNGVAG